MGYVDDKLYMNVYDTFSFIDRSAEIHIGYVDDNDKLYMNVYYTFSLIDRSAELYRTYKVCV